MKALTLSIVIPAYNEEDQLAACLTAIGGQIEPPDEVIVVDNNSSDNTAKIAKSYPFVRVVSEKNQGLRFARNRGMAEAKGEIIGRIDADTHLTPDWCGAVRRQFEDQTISASTGPCYYHDMPIKDTGLKVDHFIRKTLFYVDKSPLLYGSNMVVRKSAWDEILGSLCTDGEFFEDYDVTIHLREHGHRIAFNPAQIVGVSSRKLDDSPRRFARDMKLHTETFARHGERSPAAVGGKFVFLSVYPMMKMVRNAYDPMTGKLSLRRATRLQKQKRPTSNT